jgi:hypothetical protein
MQRGAVTAPSQSMIPVTFPSSSDDEGLVIVRRRFAGEGRAREDDIDDLAYASELMELLYILLVVFIT